MGRRTNIKLERDYQCYISFNDGADVTGADVQLILITTFMIYLRTNGFEG